MGGWRCLGALLFLFFVSSLLRFLRFGGFYWTVDDGRVESREPGYQTKTRTNTNGNANAAHTTYKTSEPETEFTSLSPARPPVCPFVCPWALVP